MDRPPVSGPCHDIDLRIVFVIEGVEQRKSPQVAGKDGHAIFDGTETDFRRRSMTPTTRPCPMCGARLAANPYEPPMCGGCHSEPSYTVMSAATQLRETATARDFINIAA